EGRRRGGQARVAGHGANLPAPPGFSPGSFSRNAQLPLRTSGPLAAVEALARSAISLLCGFAAWRENKKCSKFPPRRLRASARSHGFARTVLLGTKFSRKGAKAQREIGPP